MEKSEKGKSLVVHNHGMVSFTNLQLDITDKFLKRESKDWLEEAKNHIQKKEYPEAIDACAKAIQITPNEATPYLSLIHI